jgi:hypothetical protein
MDSQHIIVGTAPYHSKAEANPILRWQAAGELGCSAMRLECLALIEKWTLRQKFVRVVIIQVKKGVTMGVVRWSPWSVKWVCQKWICVG